MEYHPFVDIGIWFHISSGRAFILCQNVNATRFRTNITRGTLTTRECLAKRYNFLLYLNIPTRINLIVFKNKIKVNSDRSHQFGK